MTSLTKESTCRLHELIDRIQAKGWPRYSENPDLCMERAGEFMDGWKKIREDQEDQERKQARLAEEERASHEID